MDEANNQLSAKRLAVNGNGWGAGPKFQDHKEKASVFITSGAHQLLDAHQATAPTE
jgi:hypothetical protein